MAATTAPRKTVSIYDYPEHLNPFHEEDNHNKIRFWTIGKRLNRSNSINFSGIKDLKNSWALRSFMKKGKKSQQTTEKPTSQQNGESSPIMYRRAIQYSAASRSTVGSPEKPDRYVYGGSVTPLPRSRFQERLRSTSHHEVNSLSLTPRMARSEVTGSQLSLESTNPFDEECPVPPVRMLRRKKKRAPQPPGDSVTSTPDTTLNTTADSIADTAINVSSDLQVTEPEEKKINNTETDLELEDMMKLNIELKIIEDEEKKLKIISNDLNKENNNEIIEKSVIPNSDQVLDNEKTKSQSNGDIPIGNQEANRNSFSDEDIPVTFRKIDITKYRRNSSVNEDDIRLRRGNLEDFQSLNNKRSKSLTNALDATYMTYDIDLNDNTTQFDTNGNEEPQKVVCKLYDKTQRKSIETISSTEKEFLEIDRATRELEREINKLNTALNDEELPLVGGRLSVSQIKKKFDNKDVSSPNPIPKPRRSHYGGGSNSP